MHGTGTQLQEREGNYVPSSADAMRVVPKDELDHAWRYFALHAGQRLSMFNYFVLLFGIAAAGLGGCLRENGILRLVGVVVGLTLAAIAFAFYKLDERSSFLIKHAEDSLRALERKALAVEGRLFVEEPPGTRYAQAARGLWTYGRSFRFVFVVAGLVGVAGSVLALVLYFRHQ